MRSRHPMYVCALLFASIGCSRRDEEGCRKQCAKMGMFDKKVQDELCLRPCSEVHATYGISIEVCQWVQAGAKGAYPDAAR